ncbi:hypothetical protein QFC19_003956 [Naganishia cerealis]|uniref:Uncharacterized protein n=1 Tax=Naganishia cerealis TaxID=610337 RepID=A0ACC2VYS7_9TREE|nr:hypothetical protein QFC19_003956 [Naganishia cerealis]
MPKKSIFRQPGAQHFQLVHRSQRDPLINDPEASQRVFRPVERANDHGKKAGAESLAQLEQAVFAGNSSATNPTLRKNEGEASLYGIYYDDSSYDYMQHLRGVGEGSGSGAVVDSVMLPAPGKGSHGASRGVNKGKGRARDDDLNDEERDDLFGIGKRPALPSSVLPSGQQLTREQAYEAQAAVPQEIAGFQPDMDPHLRQVLEALEDDAFVGDEDEVDFMDDLLAEGERDEEEDLDTWEFQEWGVDDQPQTEAHESAGPLADNEDEAGAEQTWEDRFKAFKASGKLAEVQKQAADFARSDADEAASEMADTVASLPAMKVIGGKKRRKGASDASGYSMSSSSMFRNKGLSTLDEMFDRKYEKEYAEDDEFDDENFEGSEFMSESDFDDAASTSTFAKAMRTQLLARADEEEPSLSREDMEEIMDEFLDEFEIVGNKMLPKVGGDTPAENLEIMRKTLMGLDLEGSGPADAGNQATDDADYIRKRFLRVKEEDEEEEQDKIPMLHIVGDKKDRWDAETILSTYSNIENHPASLKVVNKHPKKKTQQQSSAATDLASDEDDEDSGDDTETESTYQQKVTVARPKGESKEERKARKAAVKAERQDRRFEKKSKQEMFNSERKKQLSKHVQLVGNGKAADLTVSARDRVNTIKL